MNPLDPFEQLKKYEKARKVYKKKKNVVKNVNHGNRLKPIFCGKEKIKFTKILNHNL